MKRTVTVAECPCCEHSLTFEQVKSLWGKATSAQRKTHSGGKDGRPRSADRCPCGVMTKARAAQRRHVCQGGELMATKWRKLRNA